MLIVIQPQREKESTKYPYDALYVLDLGTVISISNDVGSKWRLIATKLGAADYVILTKSIESKEVLKELVREIERKIQIAADTQRPYLRIDIDELLNVVQKRVEKDYHKKKLRESFGLP